VLSIVLALSSAVAFGMSDFAGGLASRRVEALRVVLVSYPISAVVIGVAAPFVGGETTTQALLWGVSSGVVMALAMWWFYLALAEGPMSVVSPLTAVLVAGLPVVVGLFTGERFSPLGGVGIVAALGAVLLVSRESSDEYSRRRSRALTPRVVRLSLGAGACFALSFIFTHQISSDSGLWPLFAARLIASLIVVLAALFTRQLTPIRGWPLTLATGVGLLDVVANVTLLYAFHAGMLSLVSVLVSLYPAITVGLAVVVLRERVTRTQTFGLTLAAIAVTLIAIAG